MKKKCQTAIELIEKHLESTMGKDEQALNDEKRYHFVNKFSPKKCPNEEIKREDIRHLYSWTHHAPLQWFQHFNKVDKDIQRTKTGNSNPI